MGLSRSVWITRRKVVCVWSVLAVDGNASVHDGLDDQIPVGCFLRADDQECLVLGHMLARMHVLGHVLDRMHVLGHVLDCVNALMPNALMLLSMH